MQARTQHFKSCSTSTSILNSAGEGICGLDHEGESRANPAAAKISGWPIELIGKALPLIQRLEATPVRGLGRATLSRSCIGRMGANFKPVCRLRSERTSDRRDRGFQRHHRAQNSSEELTQKGSQLTQRQPARLQINADSNSLRLWRRMIFKPLRKSGVWRSTGQNVAPINWAKAGIIWNRCITQRCGCND